MSQASVHLLHSGSEEYHDAILHDDVTDEHLGMWGSSWLPAMKVYKSAPTGDTPEDAHWDWKKKAAGWRTLLSYQSFALTCDGDLQGLMLVNNSVFGKLQEQFGKPLVYIEFVATAPWNRSEQGTPPRYRGCGTLFILAAIKLSQHLGYKGRISLHSLPKAEHFYAQKCGFTKLGPDPDHQGLTYYEMTETQAERFCQQP